jgi:hypothetical protein
MTIKFSIFPFHFPFQDPPKFTQIGIFWVWQISHLATLFQMLTIFGEKRDWDCRVQLQIAIAGFTRRAENENWPKKILSSFFPT